MSFDRTTEIIARMQRYADTSNDLLLRMMFGKPGFTVQVQHTTEQTGQTWTTPGFQEMLAKSLGEVIGSWQEAQYDLLLASSITLPYLPVAAETVRVFREGILMRRVASSPQTITEYNVSNSVISFSQVLSGWFHVNYLAKLSY